MSASEHSWEPALSHPELSFLAGLPSDLEDPGCSGGCADCSIPSRKRSREELEQEGLESLIAELGAVDNSHLHSLHSMDNLDLGSLAGHPGGASSSRDPDEPAGGEPSGAADDPKKESAAARNKACREKARRERLNDSFAELAAVLDPRKASRADKGSLVADAIRAIVQLRAENHQLKQLNKLLEERVSHSEKQRSQLLLQQQAMQAGPYVHAAHAHAHPHAHSHPHAHAPQGLPLLQAHPMAGQPYVVTGMPVGAHADMGAGQRLLLPRPPGHAAAPTSQPLMQQPGAQHAQHGQHTQQGQPEALGHKMSGGDVAAGVQVGVAPPNWLPADMLDTSMDHLRRPPAA